MANTTKNLADSKFHKKFLKYTPQDIFNKFGLDVPDNGESNINTLVVKTQKKLQKLDTYRKKTRKAIIITSFFTTLFTLSMIGATITAKSRKAANFTVNIFSKFGNNGAVFARKLLQKNSTIATFSVAGSILSILGLIFSLIMNIRFKKQENRKLTLIQDEKDKIKARGLTPSKTDLISQQLIKKQNILQ